MKSSYLVRATRFLHAIYPYICDDLTDWYHVRNGVDNFNRDRTRNVELSNGSARMALITSDYVVKWDYDEEAVKEIGGCVDEWELYQDAVMDGYEYLLAKTDLVVIEGHTFSIMPRIRNIGAQHHHGDIEDYLTFDEYRWLLGMVSDLHSWNWGIVNNKACVIDYAMSNSVVERAEYSGSSYYSHSSLG